MYVPAFETETPVSFRVVGYSSGNSDNQLFQQSLATPVVNVQGTDVNVPFLNVGNITD
jgi:hypothetical protein